MFRVEMYYQVRRACLVEGMSVREASRMFGLHRDTVRRMLANAKPQGYTRKSPPREPKIEPFTGVIDAILESDRRVPRKQRHTVKRIFERLRDEYGFEGQHTIVKDYAREHRRRRGRSSCRCPMIQATPSATSARQWWSSAACSGRPTASS